MLARTHIVAFIISFIVSIIATPIVRWLALKKGWLDRPTEDRKVHLTPIPRIGGLAIILGFYTPMLGAIIYHNKLSTAITDNTRLFTGLFVGGFLTMLIGLYDDIKGATAWQKLIAQIIIGTVSYLFGYHFDTIRLPYFGIIHIWEPISILLTIIWFVILMNAMNLVDGLDGLAAGVSFIVLTTLGVMSYLDKSSILLLFIASLAGAVAGFWPYNKPPAAIFMGDTGSLFLGYTLAAVSIQTAAKASTLVAMFIPLFALALPVLDTSFAIIRRLIKGQPIMSGDREHIHHKLLDLGLSQASSVAILYIISILFGITAIIFKIGDKLESYLALIALIVIAGAMFRFSGLLSLIKSKLQHREINESLIRDLINQSVMAWDSQDLQKLNQLLNALASETGIRWIGIYQDGRLIASSSSQKILINSDLLVRFPVPSNGLVLEAWIKRTSFDTAVKQSTWMQIMAWRFGHPSRNITAFNIPT